MPTFQGQISEEEMIQLIAYIQSLRPGDTPRRVEELSAAVRNDASNDHVKQLPGAEVPKP